MREHIEACTQSGLTVSDYCKQHGVVKSVYYYWYKKIMTPERQGSFVPIDLNNTALSCGIEVIYPNGVRVLVPASASLSILKVLITA